MSGCLHRCRGKLLKRAGVEVGRSGWSRADKGLIEFSPDRVSLGAWDMPYAEVRRATLVRCDSVWFAKSWVLVLEGEAETAQLALPDTWVTRAELPFEVSEGISQNGAGLWLARGLIIAAILSIFLLQIVCVIAAEMVD